MTRWTTSVLATAIALTMGLTATMAQAQPDQRHGGGQGHSQGGGHGNARPDHGRPGHGNARPDHGRPGPSHNMRPDHGRPGYGPGMHRPPGPPQMHGGYHGAGPQHNWVRGSRVPPQYRSYQYVVNDWRGHRLSAPPRGYHWVQYGGDYLMVAIATGVIAQLILSN